MNNTIGIRHEDKYVMERRVAITPAHAAELIKDLFDQRQENTILRQQVGKDSMTNLNNHQRFRELLQKEMTRSARY